MTEETQFVKVHVRTTHTGDDSKSETNSIYEVYVGDYETVEEKRIVLYQRIKQKSESSLNIEFDILSNH